MSHTTQHAYTVSFDAVLEKMLDEDFLRAKYEAIGSRNVSVSECAQDGDVFRIKCSREVRSNPPAFARKFLSEWNSLSETIEWTRQSNGNAHADYVAVTHGVPGSIEGQFDLSPRGEGCVEDIVMTASARIPMIGKKLQPWSKESLRTRWPKSTRLSAQRWKKTEAT